MKLLADKIIESLENNPNEWVVGEYWARGRNIEVWVGNGAWGMWFYNCETKEKIGKVNLLPFASFVPWRRRLWRALQRNVAERAARAVQ